MCSKACYCPFLKNDENWDWALERLQRRLKSAVKDSVVRNRIFLVAYLGALQERYESGERTRCLYAGMIGSDTDLALETGLSSESGT